MGCGQSGLSPDVRDQMKKEAVHSKQIDQTNMKDHQDEMTVAKLLFLGPGESGKSTLLKQMNYLYGVGYDDEKRAGFKEYIYDNIFEGISTLITYSEKLIERGINSKILPEHEPSKQFFVRLMDERNQQPRSDKLTAEPMPKKIIKQFVVDEDAAKHIETLWKDPGIQLAYENRALFQLPDSASYYFDKIREIGKPDYLPTDADVLRTRVRSTGVFQATFCVKNLTFRVFDVGGQRNERKKWIHCFDNVTAVIYVVAVNEYNQTMWECQTKNRMLDSLELFDQVCNSPYFEKTSMILFFNKTDLFEDRIKTVPLSVCFPEIDETIILEEERFGGRRYKHKCLDFLKSKFRSVNRSQVKRIYVHFTTATDTQNCEVVFEAVRDIIVRVNLMNNRLLV